MARVLQQFFALYRKNALVALRNGKSTALRLLASFFFLLLALVIEKALRADDANQANFKVDRNPKTTLIDPIPSCHKDLYIADKNCYDLLWTPSNSTLAEGLVKNIMANNPGRPIPSERVKGFLTRKESDAYLLKNWETVIAAIHFDVISDDRIGFSLQTNTSVKFIKGNFQDANKFVQLPLQLAAHREITRYHLNRVNRTQEAKDLDLKVGLKIFSHPNLDTVSLIGQVLGPFIFAACMFSFVIQLSVVVTEKENGLKQALRTMGMTDSAYWMSWVAWEMTMAFISAHLICIFGLILQFKMFLRNDYGNLFFTFFLFLMAMSSVAWFVASFIRRAAIAIYIGFVIFLVGWIFQVVVIFGVPYKPNFYHKINGAVTIIFSAFPWSLLAKSVIDLGNAAEGDYPGIKWSQRNSYCKDLDVTQQPSYDIRKIYYDFDCVMPLGKVYWIQVVLTLGYLVLAIYFDNILPNETGVRKSPWYFLLPSFWVKGTTSANAALNRVANTAGAQPIDPSLDEDVADEEKKMRGVVNHRTGRAGAMSEQINPAFVEVYGLRRVFPQRGGPFVAIKNSWFSIEQNRLFCLLGPNGAGKTTTINCLTGVLPPSSGDALVCGESISSDGGMDRIRSTMGVCPQFDVLWNELTGREHLEVYGHIKGITSSSVRREAQTLLERVKLTYAGDSRSSSYSGGMKRRLSVAMALLGDPRVVYLDEPTTGMDPISRRYVWDIIEEAKKGRAIILTTHSMEEADILGDRIAIMARGQLRCIGTAIRLKQRFGSGYQISVSVAPVRGSVPDLQVLAQRSEAVKDFFRRQLGVEASDESKAYIQFSISREQEATLVPFLQRLEASKASLGISDIQITLTSLEEVFLNIARQAELEASKDKLVPVTLPDGTELQVGVGAEFVQDPRTSIVWQVLWGQDEAGRLTPLNVRQPPPGAIPGGPPAPGLPNPSGPYAPLPPPPGNGYGTSGLPPPPRSLQMATMPSAPPPQIVLVRLPDTGMDIQVPVGERFVMDPRTQRKYQVDWATTANGLPMPTDVRPLPQVVG